MINADMRVYNYYTYGEEDEYGQRTLSKEPTGTIKMAIYVNSLAVEESNIKYHNCDYVGLTHANVDDTYVIEYGEERLKVSYAILRGCYNQALMVKI